MDGIGSKTIRNLNSHIGGREMLSNTQSPPTGGDFKLLKSASKCHWKEPGMTKCVNAYQDLPPISIVKMTLPGL